MNTHSANLRLQDHQQETNNRASVEKRLDTVRKNRPSGLFPEHQHISSHFYGQELTTYFKSMQQTSLLTQEEELSLGSAIKDNLDALLTRVLATRTSFIPMLGLQKQIKLWQNDPKACGLSIETILCFMDKLLVKIKSNPQLDLELAAFTAEVRERRSLVQSALNRMVTANLRLVVKIAKNYRHRGVSFQDLIQEGNLGLMKACLRFDYTTGYRFSTFAHWWIRQSIIRALHGQSHTIRLPVHFYSRINAFHKSFFQLRQDLGRDPTIEEISEASGLSKAKILAVIRANYEPVSLETPIGSDGDKLADHIENPDTISPEQATEENQMMKLLSNCMASLCPRDRQILSLRFGLDDGEPQTLEQVGLHMNISRERVRQLEKRALHRMRCFAENGRN
jgi:RNA polymerase primary sigma factor